MNEERYFQNIEPCGEAMALEIAAQLRMAIDVREKASLAVSGGRTPIYVLPVLAAQNIAWKQVSVTLTDERWVDPHHDDSNEKLIRRRLMTGDAGIVSFAGFKNAAETPEKGWKICEESLQQFPLPLDVVFLGLGEDGHIASLFPGSVHQNSQHLCVAVAAPDGSHSRISLTPAAILAARHIMLILSGDRKKAVYELAKRPGPVADLPVRLVLHQDKVPVTVFIADG